MNITTKLIRQMIEQGIKAPQHTIRRRHRLRQGLVLNVSLPALNIGVVIQGDAVQMNAPNDWAVLFITPNVVKSGDAVQRLKMLIKARGLQNAKR